jgi:hypothetical protein
MVRCLFLSVVLLMSGVAVCLSVADVNYTKPYPFGEATQWAKGSDNSAVGEWWKKSFTNAWQRYEKLGGEVVYVS